MRNSKFSIFCPSFILTSILLLSFSLTSFSQSYHINSAQGPQQVNNPQKWVDRSGELPGMSTGTVILIGAATAAAVLAIVLIINKGDDEDNSTNSSEGNKEENDTEENPADLLDGGSPFSLLQHNLKNEHNEYTEQQIPLNIYLSMKRNNLQSSDNTFEIGVMLNF